MSHLPTHDPPRSRDEALLERNILRTFGPAPDLAIFKNEVGGGVPVSVVYRALDIITRQCGPIPREARDLIARSILTYGLAVGSPDLVVWRGQRSALVELKAPGGTLSDSQVVFHEAARAKGMPVFTVWSESEFGAVVASLREG